MTAQTARGSLAFLRWFASRVWAYRIGWQTFTRRGGRRTESAWTWRDSLTGRARTPRLILCGLRYPAWIREIKGRRRWKCSFTRRRMELPKQQTTTPLERAAEEKSRFREICGTL